MKNYQQKVKECYQPKIDLDKRKEIEVRKELMSRPREKTDYEGRLNFMNTNRLFFPLQTK